MEGVVIVVIQAGAGGDGVIAVNVIVLGWRGHHCRCLGGGGRVAIIAICWLLLACWDGGGSSL